MLFVGELFTNILVRRVGLSSSDISNGRLSLQPFPFARPRLFGSHLSTARSCAPLCPPLEVGRYRTSGFSSNLALRILGEISRNSRLPSRLASYFAGFYPTSAASYSEIAEKHLVWVRRGIFQRAA
jgi:hypothetical protein